MSLSVGVLAGGNGDIRSFGFGETADVARAIAFFLSDESRWVTGQNLFMDGGSTLNTK